MANIHSLLMIPAIIAVACVPVLANHGPGASGGGAFTISGETLKPGSLEFDVREDFAKFEHFDRSSAESRVIGTGDFDALDHGFITTVDGACGITENFQIGGSLGYFIGNQFVSATDNGDGTAESSDGNPRGLTDLAIVGKYRILSGQPGNLAVIGGTIFPTGRYDFRLKNGELLSPTDQPGTGRYGFPIGLAYSRFLTKQITIDASGLYTFRTRRDDFKVGDRFDAGAALAYRLTESIKTFPQYSAFLETNYVHLNKDHVDGQNDPNSGSDALYLTPGFRVRFDSHSALTVAPSIPVFQDLNGNQGRVEFKMAITYSFSF